MASLLPGMENINFQPMIANAIYYLGIALLSIALLAVIWFAWRMTTFKIKVTIYPLVGSNKDGIFAIGKPKFNRVKWTKNRMAWVSMKPLMNSKEREPFDQEFIYGNEIIAYELNDEWIPGRHNLNLEEDTIRAAIQPVPIYLRNWQANKYKEHAEMFSKLDFWSENRTMLTALAVSAMCLIIVGVTVYLTYKFNAGVIVSNNGLMEAIKNFDIIKGIAPG